MAELQVQEFNFTFTHRGKILNASCQKMHVYKYPHLRVIVNREKGLTDIYIFFEIDAPSQKYFWFELTGMKQEIAKSISQAL